MKYIDTYFEMRSVDDDQRIIEGIATTSDIALDGMILETRGIEFKLPIPFLLNHDVRMPLGNVVSAIVEDNEIRIRAKMLPVGIDEEVDKAFQKIKHGAIRGLSIRWKTLQEKFDRAVNALRITKSKWIELSATAVGVDQNAIITSFRSADEAVLAALGNKERSSVVRLTSNPPGVSGLTRIKHMAKKTVAEQILDFQTKRQANAAQMDEIMDKASEESRSLATEESEKYDALKNENKEVDAHIERLKEHEASILSRAVQVPATATPQQQQQVRRYEPVQVRSMAPKGIFPARMAIAMYRAGNNPYVAADLARKHWPDMPELDLTLRAIVEAGDTTTSGWASQLVPSAQQLAGEFIDMYRAKTIIGRIPGIRRVPFNVAVPIRTAAGTFQWVGEAVAKPVTQETFTNITLTWAKAAAIIVITQELAKFSSPDAEVLIRDSMVETLVRFFDTAFMSTNAAVANVSPAGILNGISVITPSGTTMNAFRADLNNMLNNFTANNIPLNQIVLLMNDTTAVALTLARTDLGIKIFEGMSPNGGTLEGLFPVVTSENVGNRIVGLKASDILLAEDPGVMVTASDQATIEMETTPAVGEQSPPSTQSVLKSMFQNNCIAIRAEQFKTWARARTTAVEIINAPAYIPGT